jgi:hypothetical protein
MAKFFFGTKKNNLKFTNIVEGKGLRTLDTFKGMHTFQVISFNLSAISPSKIYTFIKLKKKVLTPV